MDIFLPAKNGLKLPNTYRENVKKDAQDRKRNIIHLIHKYLIDHNLNSSAESLENEAQINFQYQICENIDLEIILEEFRSYYYTKFQKEVKILRKVPENEAQVVKKNKKSPSISASANKPKSINSSVSFDDNKPQENNFQFEILPITSNNRGHNQTIYTYPECTQNEKHLTDFDDYSQEWREIADQIIKQIIPKNLGTKFENCIGLTSTIETLKEAVIYPLEYPELFKNFYSWSGVLLYGPPGTGKTLLARALACESSCNVINVTSSAFISKWRGESEKMVKVLFDVAKLYAPTTIFIDEIDALCSNQESNHEASRRFRSELLVQIDGVLKGRENIFILATTNNPWTLSRALLRRFEKRILVPLPDKPSRGLMFQSFLSDALSKARVCREDFIKIVESTENFSGSDIRNVCKEVEMAMVRARLKEVKIGDKGDKRILCSGDIFDALQKIRPLDSEGGVYKEYMQWGAKYGAC